MAAEGVVFLERNEINYTFDETENNSLWGILDAKL